MSSYEEKEKEFYPRSSLHRPKELDIGGSGDYCCIPLCKNSTYDRDKMKTGIGFFRFHLILNSRKDGFKSYQSIEEKEELIHLVLKNPQKFVSFNFQLVASMLVSTLERNRYTLEANCRPVCTFLYRRFDFKFD